MLEKRTIKIKAVVITLALIGTALLVPVSSTSISQEKTLNELNVEKTILSSKSVDESEQIDPYQLDRNYYLSDPSLETNDEDLGDAGTRRDAGDDMRRSTIIYPGEPIDESPGRLRNGELSAGDDDYYRFSVCEGQDFVCTLDPQSGYNFDLELYDKNEVVVESSTNPGSSSESISFTAEYSGQYWIAITYTDGSGTGDYTFDVTLSNQNDIGINNDAGDSINSATPLSPGDYYGYLDYTDEQDWYALTVNQGQGIHVVLEMDDTAIYSDFDISLYNPSGEFVHEEDFYYNDELLYPADETGTWFIKIDIFPGYTDLPYEDEDWEYYAYGSGAYHLIYSIESSAPDLPDPIPQDQIKPVSKTIIINNDENSNNDEYAYLASIPASNYLENGQRYLSPIVYQGDDTSTNYFGTDADRGTVDTTTQYLLDDWTSYLDIFGKTSEEYTVPSDPIEAAAEIATKYWTSSDTAVVSVIGSEFTDEVEIVIEESTTLQRKTEVETLQSDSSKLTGSNGYPMFIGKEWCAMSLDALDITKTYGDDPCTNLVNLFPGFMSMGSDWWPTPYDGAGDATDLYLPLTEVGIWSVDTDLDYDDFGTFVITKFAGDRYTINVDGDAVLNVTIETDVPSDLQVFLVDPKGNLRSPDIPQWNGPVLEIHEWYGFENPEDNPWREWSPEDKKIVSAEVLHPESGKWTAIVVPRYEDGDSSISYTITGEVRKISEKRADAAISAANAAVIASQEHIPLLYVTENEVPAATENAFSALGVNKVIFVQRNGIGENVKSDLPSVTADLTTMQEIVDYIKDYSQSENYITITSIKSGDGYFAPASMLAAYHCSPVLRIGEAPGNPAAVADRIETWRIWDGDYYHGSRATGHLPDASEPLAGEGEWTLQLLIQAALYGLTGGSSGQLPPLGLDAKRYWNEEMHDGIYDFINGLGLDLNGQEAYAFVAPRKDIYLVAHSVMIGNNSYAGHIPGQTPAYTSALINRNVLYTALIYANPERDVTTTQLINYPDGGSWTTNDGVLHNVYSSRLLKNYFGSHGREFEGHSLWDAHLKRINDGVSVMYYSGHGTGGSGISGQPYQMEHSNYPEQIWWDAWRGYSYDNWKTARNNGRVWYNADPPMLYDIIQYDHVDNLMENLRSCAVFYMSCTTGDAFGPMVYLDHGAVLWYGNAGSGLCPEADLQDDEFFYDTLVNGESVGHAYSKQVWLHIRDFTTKDPTAMYGRSTLYAGAHITTVQVIYGDPELVVYSPEWTVPIPVDA